MKYHINFFAKEIQTEKPRKDIEFGIGDDGKLAYTTSIDSELRIGVVKNPSERLVQFTPLDHNLPAKKNGKDEESLCDGMLHIEETKEIDFVEIKTGHVNATHDAIEQLQNTITIFNSVHVAKDFNTRRAFVIDKHHHFNCSDKQLLQHFYNVYHFRVFAPVKVIDIK